MQYCHTLQRQEQRIISLKSTKTQFKIKKTEKEQILKKTIRRKNYYCKISNYSSRVSTAKTVEPNKLFNNVYKAELHTQILLCPISYLMNKEKYLSNVK